MCQLTAKTRPRHTIDAVPGVLRRARSSIAASPPSTVSALADGPTRDVFSVFQVPARTCDRSLGHPGPDLVLDPLCSAQMLARGPARDGRGVGERPEKAEGVLERKSDRPAHSGCERDRGRDRLGIRLRLQGTKSPFFWVSFFYFSPSPCLKHCTPPHHPSCRV